MRFFVDTAVPAEIEEWDEHLWVSGFTTNPTLIKAAGVRPQDVVKLTTKPISIDGPEEVWTYGPNVIRKVVTVPTEPRVRKGPINHTAICHSDQVPLLGIYNPGDIISVFAGRIMDTGRNPRPVFNHLTYAKNAQILWASVREPYNITQAEAAGCDIVTVPPAILRKYLEWHDKPLEVVADETIAQFRRDAETITW